MHNLRCLLNEVFGEENFVANLVWQKRYVSNVTAKYFSDMHDHILVYARQIEHFSVHLVERTQEQMADYKNPDNDLRGAWRAQDLSASKPYQAGVYTITTPAGITVDPPPGRYWRCHRAQYDEWVADNRIWFGREGTARPMLKAFLSEVQQGLTPNTWWDHEFAGHNKEATLEVKALFDGSAPFDTPKPVRLIQRILELAADDDALVFDFFAGSGTTAEAVLRLNAKDGGSRRFVCVQLPEPCERGSVAANMGFETIADLSRDRVKRVISVLGAQADLASPQVQPGLRCFQLAPSNFKQWRGDDIDTAAQLAEQIQLFAKAEKDGATVEAMLYELLLKFGQELSTPVETIDVAGGRVFAIQQRKMLFVLESFGDAMIEPLMALKPREIIAIDGVFKDSDTLKTNLDLQCRDAGIKFTCV